MISKTVLRGIGCAILLGAGCLEASAEVGFEALVASGDPVPFTTNGLHFAAFGPVTLNESGGMAFVAGLEGTNVVLSDDTAVFTGNSNSFLLIAREGQTNAALAPGESLGEFSNAVQIRDDSQVIFTSEIRSAFSTNDGALWLGSATGIVLLAREGQSVTNLNAPLGENAFFTTEALAPPLVGGTNLMFAAGLQTLNVNADDVLLVPGTNGWAAVAREGGAAPGIENGVFAGGLQPGETFALGGITKTGRMAFRGRVAGEEVNAFTAEGIWRGPAHRVELAIRAGDAAPGRSGKRTRQFRQFSVPALNAGGRIAFRASLADLDGPVPGNVQGIFSDVGGSWRAAAEQGQRARGVRRAAYDFFGPPLLNDGGTVFFLASLAGAKVTSENDTALFGGTSRRPRLLAREGSSLRSKRGSGPDWTFGDLHDAELGCNAFSWTFVLARIQGASATNGSTDRALVCFDPEGRAAESLRTGSPVTVVNEPRTVESIVIPEALGYGRTILRTGAGGDGRFRWMNAEGRAVLAVHFTDLSSAILMANVPQGPVFQPDVQILRPGTLSEYEAVADYRPFRPLPDPDVAVRISPGDGDLLRFRIVNAGTALDDIVIRGEALGLDGGGAQRHLTVQWRDDQGADISEQVTKGHYRLTGVAPGEERIIRAQIEADFGADSSDDLRLWLKAKSANDPRKRDLVGALVDTE